MNEEILSTEINDSVSAADPEETLISEGSASETETITELDSEIQTELDSEIETELDFETETELDSETDDSLEDLESVKESLSNTNASINELTTVLLQSSDSETIDYTEVLSEVEYNNILFNNNFCLGIEAVVLTLGIVSGCFVGSLFRGIFKK